MAQRDHAEALKWYREGLAVADHWVKTNPENADWQHKLSMSYSRSATYW